jgi:hypothetical protein
MTVVVIRMYNVHVFVETQVALTPRHEVTEQLLSVTRILLWNKSS